MDATLPSFPAFDPSPEAGDVALRWRKWVSRFRILLAAINVTNDTRQKALLLHYAGERVSDIFDTLTIPDPTGDESSTELAINALTLFFAPYANVEFAVFQFRQAKQEQTEDIASYLTRLRQLALNCDFSDVSRELKSQIIQGCRSTRLRRKALTDPTITLDNLVNLARAAEAADAHTSAMTSDTIPELVSRLKTHPSSSTTPHSRSTGKNQSTCRNCGKLWPHAGGREDCPAFDKTCRGCSKRGHFFSVCRSSNTAGNSRTSPAPRPLRVNHLEKRDTDSESDVEYLYAVRAHPMAAKPPMFNILLDGIPIHVMADSGASVNILDERDFNKLSPRRKLIHTTTRIFPYQGSTPLPVLGKLTLTVTHKSYRQRADFYVVTGTCGSILSWETSNQLHLINVVNRVTISSPKLLDEFQDIFTGLGKLKNFQVKLHIDNTVAPTAQPHRRIPFLLRKQVEAQLEADLQLGVIEKVEGATPWVSPIVVVPKPKCPGAVRICIDMRRANTAIRRERHLTPTISDIIHDLNGAKVFSKLDLNQGYNQLELEPSSRYITTFSTHVGLWRYKRLNFGISSAAEVFQNAIRESLNGLRGVTNISDDILVFGSDQTEHDFNLRACLQRIRDNGLTLNARKCVFNKQSLDFFGYTFSASGLSVDAKKVQDIVSLPPPSNISEVRSLLGMANFSSRFIPNYATLTQPLRSLLHKNVKFRWSTEQDASLIAIRQALSNAPVLAYFNENRVTEIFTDASPVGLGAILTQRLNDGESRQVIAYASRSLTEVEQRYSQTEREALAVVWACEHFHLYIFGRSVCVYTDHKPLVSIFGNPNSRPSARIERWALRLQPYAAIIAYRTGLDNPADYLSRHPQPLIQPTSREQKVAEEYVNFISNHVIPRAMTLDDIRAATEQDPTLQAVWSSIQSGRWDSKPHIPNFNQTLYEAYAKVQSDLSTDFNNGVILRLDRLVIPSSLQDQAVRLAHEGHQGITKTKALIREKVWFPGIDSLVERQVRSCIPCAAVTPSDKREPLQMSDLPDAPWTCVSVDFADVNGVYLLVLYDEYSRFPIVDIVPSTSAKTVIPRLDKIFSEFGIPSVLKSDNGPPFQSSEFKLFSAQLGFRHRKITPYWPRANAEVERFMRTAKKVVKTATIENKDWKQELNCFLRNYRATPHSTTGIAPAKLLFGRPLGVKLPQMPYTMDDADIRCHDAQQKTKMKTAADLSAHATPSSIVEGDLVLLKKAVTHSKLDSPFEPHPYMVVSRKGSMITVKRGDKQVTRNSSFLKPVITMNTQQEDQARINPHAGGPVESDSHNQTIPELATQQSDLVQNTEKSLGENISSDTDHGDNILSRGEDMPPPLPGELMGDLDPSPPIRRSLRHAGAPVWLRDFQRI